VAVAVAVATLLLAAVAFLERFEQVDGDVGDADLALLLAMALHAVVHHDVAEGAGGGDARRTGGDQLGGADVVDLGPDRLLHPHARPAGTTAHPLGAVAGRFDDRHAAEATDDLARREVDVVVATQVARVVVDDPFFQAGFGQVEAAVLDEGLEELGVVHDLVVAPELGILVAQCVEAVGALGHDLADAHAVERLDVLHGQHLEDVLVARAPGRIPGAVLGWAEDGEADVGPLHERGHGLGHLLVLVVEAARAADPVEVLGLERVATVDDLDPVDLRRPVASLTL
jgi:hypothetical protein